MALLNVPADKLLLLEDVEAFSYIQADSKKVQVRDSVLQ